MLALLATLVAAAAGDIQSLAEAARKEAERRQKLDQQGIREKRIEVPDPAQLAAKGAVSTSSPGPGLALPTVNPRDSEPKATLRSFQTRLQKLDRDIRQAEDRLKLLQARRDAARWAAIKTGKGSLGSGSSSSQEQLHWQIAEMEGNLARLRQERADIFQAGRKAGYLPGDLEGRGLSR